jgi:uncharacterized small protein (DUF1192 family)
MEGAMNERDLSKNQEVQINARVKEVGGEGSRILEFIASTENPDRSNDIIDVAGWDLSNYMGTISKGGNPVFAWSHDYSKLPVGKTISAVKDTRNKALTIRVKFPTVAEMCTDINNPSEQALFSDTVYNMYKNGMLNAVSVGFRGLEFEIRNDESVKDKTQWERGVHFKRAELLEVSAVLVPCNSDALVTMRGMKSFNEDGIKAYEKVISAKALEDSMEATKIAELEERIKTLESSAVVVKAGSKFSRESREAIGKVTEALKACHKGMKACYETLDKMIEEAPVEEQSGTEGQDGGASDGREVLKPNAGDGKSVDAPVVKELDIKTASISDVAKLFDGVK